MVLYHLEGHPSGIQDKIDTALGDKIVDADDGLTQLIAFLDGIYAEDEMTEAWTKYKQFIRLKKQLGQPVTEFIAEFDKAHTRAKESGCEFSDIVLAFNLLESCNLSDTNEKFVLTGIDFKKGKTDKNLLDQVKNSLRKFQSRERMSCEGGCSDAPMESGIKVEKSLVSNVKDALLSDGWQPPSSYLQQQQQKQQKLPPVVRKKRGEARKGKQPRKNPRGSDGKIMKCFQCKSEYHLKNDCNEEPSKKVDHTTTMLAKVLADSGVTELSMLCCVREGVSNDLQNETTNIEVVEKEEQTELVLISHDENELCLLVEEAGCRGVLDTACSKTVAGVNWIRKYTKSVSPTFANNLCVTESSKVYQFGGGEKRQSRGIVTLPTVIGDQKVNITVDNS